MFRSTGFNAMVLRRLGYKVDDFERVITEDINLTICVRSLFLATTIMNTCKFFNYPIFGFS